MTPPTIRNVRIKRERIVFELNDEREISVPISVSPRLAQATAEQREHWTIGPRGISVHWPDVDEDLAVWDVLGIGEDLYLRSLREAPVS